MSASRSSLLQQTVYSPVAQQVAQPNKSSLAEPQLRPRVRSVRSNYAKKSLPQAIYWLALGTLIFCVFQCIRTIAVESYSLVAKVNNQPIIEQYFQQTVQENHVLTDRIQNASTRQGIEAMARNYLNLTGNGEILVRLH